MSNVARDLLDICEAVEPASKFNLKNTYGAEGIKVSFELGDDESILNIKVEGDEDKRIPLETTFTKDKVTVADMQKVIDDTGMTAIQESMCFCVEVGDDEYEQVFAALSKKFDLEEDEDCLYVEANSQEEVQAVLDELKVGATCEQCIDECDDDDSDEGEDD